MEPKVLARVRALIAKAESTEFPEEAEVLTAKAQQLMARHAIDAALLEAGTGTAGVPSSRRVAVAVPYQAAKVRLLSAVARANRGRVVWDAGTGQAHVFGFAGDLDAVEVLFTSLLLQATRAAAAHGPVRDARGRSRTRSFRGSFLHGFAQRIGERLEEAVREEVAATAEGGGSALVPLLEGRERAVEDAVAAEYPRLRRLRASVTNGAGWRAGQVAGAAAALGGTPLRGASQRGTPDGARPALGA